MTDCSLRLLKLIIKYEEESLTSIEQEIMALRESVKSYETTQQYRDLSQRMQNNLSKIEEYTVALKKSKFDRDTMD